MEINIKPEDIDLYVKNAILESTVGKSIKEAIDKSIKELFSGYRNPIEGFVKDQLQSFVTEYMNSPETKTKLFTAIANKVTPEAIESIVSHGLQKLREEWDRNRY